MNTEELIHIEAIKSDFEDYIDATHEMIEVNGYKVFPSGALKSNDHCYQLSFFAFLNKNYHPPEDLTLAAKGYYRKKSVVL